MKSRPVASGQTGYPQQLDSSRDDSRGGGFLLAHQQLGALALGTNPTNGQAVTLDVNGTNIVATFVTAIGSAANNILIGVSAAASVQNLLNWLRRPDVTNSNQVAASGANQLLLSYVGWAWPGSSTTIVPFSLNKNVNDIVGSLTSYSITTTVTSGTWTAQTMQLYIEDGTYYIGTTRVLFTGGSTPTITAPVSHPRIDIVTADSTGTIAVTTGTESVSPTAPAYPANKVVICEIYNVVGETAMYDNENQQSGEGYIFNDVRPIVAPVYVGSMSQLGPALIEQSAAEISAADSGSANAYAITLSPAPASLTTGMIVQVLNIAHACTGTSTLNVNGLGAKTIHKAGSTALASGDLVAGMNAILSYDGTYWQLLSPTANITFLGLFANGATTAPSSAGTQTIAHGLGAAPKMVRIHAVDTSSIYSHGSYNGSSMASAYSANANTGPFVGNSTAYVVFIQPNSVGGVGTNAGLATIAVDATNITLTWIAGSNSYVGSFPFEWEAEA
jgi:hypothetical protein